MSQEAFDIREELMHRHPEYESWLDEVNARNFLAGRDEPEENGNDVDFPFACPVCGERNADRLLIDEDDHVECMACGNKMTIPF